MIGNEAVLHLTDVNGNEVKKIYGHDRENLTQVYLGDLRSENVRTILFLMELSGDGGDQEDIEILNYSLTYTNKQEQKIIGGSLRIKYTNNQEEVIQGENIDVKVKFVIQQTVEIDKELLELLDQDDDTEEKSNQMIELQERQIQLFEQVEDLDRELSPNNKVESMLTQARKSLEKLRNKKDKKLARKEVQHRGYTKSRG